MKLKNQIGLITGGTTGIGFETAKQALKEGAKAIVITGQNEERLSKAEQQLAAFGSVKAIKWQAQNADDTADLAREIEQEFGTLDFVFANAGVCWPTPVGEIEAKEVQQQLMVNFTAPLLLVQSLVPLMEKTGGSIVFTTSCLHELGIPGYAAYAASKAALRSLARTLSAEFMAKKIRVNSIAPGPTETPIHNKFGIDGNELENAKSGVAAMVPLGRFGEPKEVVDAAIFLLSESSSFILGEEISVDGGWSNL